ncbi:MAG: UDP-N-acetylmuramate dehydrogenase [Oligoflexales bacterium]
MKLSEVSYYQTGGLCKEWHEPKNLVELQESMEAIKGQPWFLLGAGSNSLVMDTEWFGAVLSLRSMTQIESTELGAVFGAGCVNSDVSEFAYQKEWAGGEFLYRLPGQLGGTVRMNARCYGGEIGRIARKVWTVDVHSRIKIWESPQECFKGYKDTVFMQEPLVVAQAELGFFNGRQSVIRQKMDFCEQDRIQKGQFLHPSCGCVFKNCYQAEVSVPSGMLLEHAGVIGMTHGGAVVSPQHANFVYNKNDATSREILELTLMMREKVWDAFGVWLEYEMEVLGSIPLDLKTAVSEKRAPQYSVKALQELRDLFKKR